MVTPFFRLEVKKLIETKVKESNQKAFSIIGHFLNNTPALVNEYDVIKLIELGVSSEYAVSVLISSLYGIDLIDNADDKEFFNTYFPRMIHKMNPEDYIKNSFYSNISIPSIKIGNCELKYEQYKPFNCFVCNDVLITNHGRQIPQIGFFEVEFSYPALLENDRLWMAITPNEIETMKEAINDSFGNVLTFGLGLGYYAFMVSEKSCVNSITVVEMNPDIITLFSEFILPQFKSAHKIKIVQADAFEYAENYLPASNFNFVFTDLWHDVSDGLEMYLKMKKYERLNPNIIFKYWIENSILSYIIAAKM